MKSHGRTALWSGLMMTLAFALDARAEGPMIPPAPIGANYGMVPPAAAPPANPQPGYVHLSAPLYPSPRPNIPHQVGSAIYTNQAFAPHEMLYPHEYHAMYGPFYWQVKGAWRVTPWGVRSYDRWRLLGTKVDVKYSSNYGLFSHFKPPVLH